MNKVVKEDIDSIIEEFKKSDNFNNKTILITGATGLIAKYLTYYFLEMNKECNSNIKVVALVRNLEKAKRYFKDYENDEHLEFLNQDVCEKIKYSGDVNYIFHAAGSASAMAIRNNPVDIIRANTLGTMNVLDFARDKKVEKVIFPSTREIYGEVKNVDLITEDTMGIIDPLNSRNCYPECKRMSEAIFKSYETQYGVNFNILRIAHTYGPTMELRNDGRVMSDFIANAVDGKNIVLNSDGSAIRGFCYIADNIKGILYAFINGKSGEAYNLSNESEPMMIRDVAKIICEESNKGLKVEFSNPDDEVKKGYLQYKIVKLDNSKIKSIGWTPTVSLKEGIKRTLQYFEIEEKGNK